MNIAMLDVATLNDDVDLSIFDQFGTVRRYPLTTPENLAEHSAGCEVLILNKVKITPVTFPDTGAVKLICVTATGVDNIDLDYCRNRGIAVCNVSGYSTDSVAQITVAMALSLVNHLPSYKRFVDSGAYTQSGRPNHLTPPFHELSGMTWGILGYGSIGSRVAAAAEALGCRVLVCKRAPLPDRVVTDIDTLCAESDILTIHVPLTHETRGIINRERLATMKPSAVLVNVARGAVTDEKALAEAVVNDRLGGLGVDVYSTEPLPEDHPFQRILGRDNVCLTPHMAWGAYEARVRCLQEVAENIRAFMRGEMRSRVDQ